MRLIGLAVVLSLGLTFTPHLAVAQQAGRVTGGALLRWPQDWGVLDPSDKQTASEWDSCRSGVPDVYRIDAEDLLRISVWKNESEAMSRTVPVRPDGKISLPLLNDVPAMGLTALELGGALARKVSEYMPSPNVSVIVCPGPFVRESRRPFTPHD